MTRTGGLDIGPRDAAIPLSDYVDAMTARGRPVRAARRRPRSRGAGRSGVSATSTTGCSRPTPGSPTRTAATPPTSALARAQGATLLEHTPVAGLRARADGATEVELADGAVHRAPTGRPRGRRLDERPARAFDRRLPLTIIQAQVTYFASPDPGDVRAGPVPDLDLDGRSVLLRLPDLRRARPKSAEDVGGDEVTPATRTFDRNEVGLRRG